MREAARKDKKIVCFYYYSSRYRKGRTQKGFIGKWKGVTQKP